MKLDDPHIFPVLLLIAGVLILFSPRFARVIAGLALIVYGIYKLNDIYKFLPALG